MRRHLLLASGLALGCVWLVAASCSNPLETTPPPEEPQIIQSTDSVKVTDTLLVVDTVLVSDSVIQTDTVYITDSIYFTDTVVVSDTVVRVDTVTVDDPEGCTPLCAKIGSHQKEITWLLGNDAGRHRLEFSAWTERDKPLQPLVVSVGGKTYGWTPAEDNEYSLEVDLPADAKVKVWLDHPKACGHEIYVCLMVTKL